MKLDSLHWFSQHRSPGGAHSGGLWPPNSNSGKILYNAPTNQVSSSYDYSFESYHVDNYIYW